MLDFGQGVLVDPESIIHYPKTFNQLSTINYQLLLTENSGESAIGGDAKFKGS